MKRGANNHGFDLGMGKDDEALRNIFSSPPLNSDQSGQLQSNLGKKLSTSNDLTYAKVVKEKDKILIVRIKESFEGHPNQILGLDTMCKNHKKPVLFDEAMDFVNRVKTRFQDDDNVYKSFLIILNMYGKEHKSLGQVYQEVGNLFRDHQDLLADFTRFLPHNSQASNRPIPRNSGVRSLVQKERSSELPSNEKELDKSLIREGHESRSSKEFVFLEKVKERLDKYDTSTYLDFLKCLHLYSQKQISKACLQVLIDDILGKHHDLIGEKHAFFSQEEIVQDRKKKHHGLEQARDRDIHDRDNNIKKRLNRMKYMNNPISKLDLTGCESCTPSYRRLPEDYPNISASYRTELDASVLNDQWVSVSSQERPFKDVTKNQNEEVMLRCEEERSELDILIESAKSTIEKVEFLLQLQGKACKQEFGAFVEDRLTPMNRRCIERLYDNHGMDVIDAMKENPAIALPVILGRLKHKRDEWIRCKNDFNKVWSKIYLQNHVRSLDNQSSNFKHEYTENEISKDIEDLPART